MHSTRKEKTVGAVTFLALVLAVFVSYSKSDSSVNDDFYEVSAVFGRVDGLGDDADVRMGGVKIGHVIKADLNKNYRAVIIMLIDKSIILPIDTSAAIHTDGLFGGKFIELEPGGDEESLKNGSAIDMTQSSVVVEELLELIISEGKAKRATKAKDQ